MFHNSTRVRREINRIYAIRSVDGTLIEKIEDIDKEVVSFFQNLLNDREGSNMEC